MCVFCKIIKGEIPSFKIYETEDLVAFLDISQATKGHTLIVPKKHVENVFGLNEVEASEIMKAAVIGLGVEGKKAVNSLLKHGWEVYATDLNINVDLLYVFVLPAIAIWVIISTRR